MDQLAENLVKSKNTNFVFFVTTLAIFYEIPPDQYEFIFDKTEKYEPRKSLKNYIIRLYALINNNDKLITYILIPLGYLYFFSRVTKSEEL